MRAKISLIFFVTIAVGLLQAVQFFVNHGSAPLLNVVEGEVRPMEPLENRW